MRNIRLFSLVLALFASASHTAWAGECVVSEPDGLSKKIEKAIESGGCETDSAVYRDRYEKYRGDSLNFQVIRFESSALISAPFPCLTGFNGEPLIIFADPKSTITIESSQKSCIDGKNGPVILDNIIFKGGGLEISSDNNAVLNSLIDGGSVKILGNANHLASTEIRSSSTSGLDLYGDDTKIEDLSVEESEGFGIYIKGNGTKIIGGHIEENKKGGVFINDGASALISRTEFSKNVGEPISVENEPMPRPINLVSVDAGNEVKITGNIEEPSGIWKDMNFKAVKIELFIKDGAYLAETDKIDPATRQFVFTLAKPAGNPVFTATAVSYEEGATSPFSVPLDIVGQADLDGDGIPNDQEDYNHNGVVDFDETDPRNYDTDLDGLSDGEERLHTGRIQEAADKGHIANLSKLNPTNPDSDGDCLIDGLEVGIQSTPIDSTMKAMLGAGEDDISEKLSPFCRSILTKHNVLKVAQGDLDPQSTTDPTNADTDNDGVKDGEEDWNFNGKRDGEPYLETDPLLPDSDGDAILDGTEGDVNNDGKLDEYETDPLLKDTDNDGAGDDLEINRVGSLPNSCDTDKDGLSDGVETGSINPNPKNPKCAGLQSAGTNFASIEVLSAIKIDSDGDHLSDGEEDVNGNGWLDINETDPTTWDTDADGISDDTERKLDVDHDGVRDVNLNLLDNGIKCAPPENEFDVDCDGIDNARDDDSDGDTCPDRDEGINLDSNINGVPDVWESSVSSCGKSVASSVGAGNGNNGGGLGGGASGNVSGGGAGETAVGGQTPFKQDLTGGGACSMVLGANNPPIGCNTLMLILPTLLLIFLKRGTLGKI